MDLRDMRSGSATRKDAKTCRRRTHAALQLSIPSRLSAVEPVCEKIRAILTSQQLGEWLFEVELVARECLNNAILHGNAGLPHSRVSFNLRLGRGRICLRVADQGPGFDWRGARRGLPAQADPGGRGLLLVTTRAERVRFNRKGNQITVWIATPKEGR